MSWFCLALAAVTFGGLLMVVRSEHIASGAHRADPDHTDYQAKFLDDERKGKQP